MTFRTLLGAAIAVAGLTSSASAFDWSGFYAGVHAGYGAGTDDVFTTLLDADRDPYLPTAENSFDVDGALGGIQIGFNHQVGALVFGLEADYSITAIEGSFQFDPTRDEAIAGGGLDYLASLRARVGAAFDNTMIYATAGFAYGGGSGYANNVWSVAPAVDVATGESSGGGYVIGAGVEHALADNVSIRAEYLHYNLTRNGFDMTSEAYPDGTVLYTEPQFTLGVIRAGINFHF